MATSPLRVVGDDDMLLFEIQRRRIPWARFSATFGAYVASVVQKVARARGLCDADREDVLQETFLHIVGPDRPRYEPSRSAARTYLYYAVQSAAHVVMGRRRRREAPLDTHAEGEDDGGSLAYAGLISEPTQTAYEAHEFTEFVLLEFSKTDRYALLEVAEDRSIAEVGAEVGVSRSALSRRIKGLRERACARADEAMAI